jgi:hypothetical protein
MYGILNPKVFMLSVYFWAMALIAICPLIVAGFWAVESIYSVCLLLGYGFNSHMPINRRGIPGG